MKTKLCALLLSVLMLGSLSGCKQVAVVMTVAAVVAAYDVVLPDAQQYASVLKRNWDISLPKGFELVYSGEIPSPHGDGLRYAVLYYLNPSMLDEFQIWSREDGTTYYHNSYTGLVEDAIDYLSVPEEFHPSYGEQLWFYANSADDPRDEILMLRNGDLLYIIQSFL